MPARPVRSTVPLDSARIHLFQVVRERRAGGDEDWIVVGLARDRIDLASVGFDWHRAVPVSAFEDGPFEPLVAGGVPVWGY